MALQVIREGDAMRNGKPVFCPNFSMLMYDTPDEDSIRNVLKKAYGDGELLIKENGRYEYVSPEETYHGSTF